MYYAIVKCTQNEFKFTFAIDYCTIFYFFLQICLDISKKLFIIIIAARECCKRESN